MAKRKKKRARRPLTDQQKQAAQLFFDGLKPGQIAEQIGVHRSTIWRWRNRPDFRREIDRITDKWRRDMRREYQKRWHNSPEYKQQQRRKYAARQKLKRLEKKISDAGNRGDMKAYAAACKEYDRCFNIAYFGGLSAAEFAEKFMNQSRETKGTKKQAKPPVKYVVEIL